MPTAKPNGARTIEEIEALAADVLHQEQQAIAALVGCMREIAVRLPVESRLPLDLASAANSLELWTTSKWPGSGLSCAIAGLQFTEAAGGGVLGQLANSIDKYMPRGESR